MDATRPSPVTVFPVIVAFTEPFAVIASFMESVTVSLGARKLTDFERLQSRSCRASPPSS
jgi:hypothetical protein